MYICDQPYQKSNGRKNINIRRLVTSWGTVRQGSLGRDKVSLFLGLDGELKINE